MARPKHTHVCGGIYLVSSIGEHGRTIFVDDGDRVALGQLVAQVIARCGAQIHAFKWLENELLMVLQVYADSVSDVMQRIASLHARRVNQRLGHRGNLFQHPHRAVLLEDSVTVLEAVATVHRNPVSEWSSHRAYLGLEEIPWLTRQMILEFLSAVPAAQPAAYSALMKGDEAWKHALRLQPGGSARRRPWRAHDGFVAWLKVRSAQRTRPATLDELIQAVARWLAVDPAALESTATSPLLSLARALITWAAMENGIASLADLARRFGRGRSTLHETREIYRARAPQIFNLRLTDILAGPAFALPEVLQLLEGPNTKDSAR